MKNTAQYHITTLFRVLVKFLLFVLITTVVSFALLLFSILFIDQDTMLTTLSSDLNAANVNYYSLFYACIALGQLMGFFVIYRGIEKKSLSKMGMNWAVFPKQFLSGSLWGILLISSVFATLWLSNIIEVVQVNWSWKLLSEFFLFFFFVALVEEFIFRVFTINLISEKYGNIAALVVSSLLFTLVHNTNPGYDLIPFFSILLGGVLLGILYLKSRQLWLPLGFHLTWNFFQGNIYGFEVSGLQTQSLLQITKQDYPLLTGGDFGMEGSLLGLLALVLCIIFYQKDFRNIWIGDLEMDKTKP